MAASYSLGSFSYANIQHCDGEMLICIKIFSLDENKKIVTNQVKLNQKQFEKLLQIKLTTFKDNQVSDLPSSQSS